MEDYNQFNDDFNMMDHSSTVQTKDACFLSQAVYHDPYENFNYSDHSFGHHEYSFGNLESQATTQNFGHNLSGDSLSPTLTGNSKCDQICETLYQSPQNVLPDTISTMSSAWDLCECHQKCFKSRDQNYGIFLETFMSEPSSTSTPLLMLDEQCSSPPFARPIVPLGSFSRENFHQNSQMDAGWVPQHMLQPLCYVNPTLSVCTQIPGGIEESSLSRPDFVFGEEESQPSRLRCPLPGILPSPILGPREFGHKPDRFESKHENFLKQSSQSNMKMYELKSCTRNCLNSSSSSILNRICGVAPSSTAANSHVRRQYSAKDNFLVQKRLSGMSYKDIKREGGYTEAESTLRGRFRTLTKPKSARVRKPEWSEKDINLLRQAVSELGTRGGRSRIPWKKVAEHIVRNGGTYQFGNSTCRKRWDELQNG
ncbi:hypothetical protein GcM3_216042 [Golovinomyces cichoracearum]|uniref:Myb-like domain-containing protein n=1 Tax=Golovinomyces cichoracearum TaxID=62708 RepID=A0A420H8C0_9PEZI|nr:hypothetical protein GcM3_216042 [Golovinomyces cichoracearum]